MRRRVQGVRHMQQAGRRVLLVEDDPLILRNTADVLEGGGYEVVQACCFEEGMSGLDAEPALLVTDIDLKGHPAGLELARSAAERLPDIRIVLVSGHVRPAVHQYPEKAVFFTKPYPPDALLTILADSAYW